MDIMYHQGLCKLLIYFQSNNVTSHQFAVILTSASEKHFTHYLHPPIKYPVHSVCSIFLIANCVSLKYSSNKALTKMFVSFRVRCEAIRVSPFQISNKSSY